MKRLFIIFLALCFILIGCNKKKDGEQINAIKDFIIEDNLDTIVDTSCNVVILLGQSNATGVSYNLELKKNNETLYDTYKEGFSNVKINYFTENGGNNSHNKFVKTTLGAGASSDFFGPEIGIAEKFSTCKDKDTYIIKYTWGGTILDSHWLSNFKRGELYTAAINFTKTSLDYLLSKGYTLDIRGICWMQGESDSFNGISNKYEQNTTNFVSFLREDLSSYSSSIKFIDAYIEDVSIWPNYSEINYAKLNYSNTNPLNYCIDTISLGLTTANEPETVDLAHYDSMSMVLLGREFGNYLI